MRQYTLYVGMLYKEALDEEVMDGEGLYEVDALYLGKLHEDVESELDESMRAPDTYPPYSILCKKFPDSRLLTLHLAFPRIQ